MITRKIINGCQITIGYDGNGYAYIEKSVECCIKGTYKVIFQYVISASLIK